MGYPGGYARQLISGVRIMNRSHHHAGMRWLKAELGNPRPVGRTSGGAPIYTLSLVHQNSPSVYEAPDGYLLSTDPDDYIWETISANHMRKDPEVRRTAAQKAGRLGGIARMALLTTPQQRREFAQYVRRGGRS
jgi:hypothetical protein